MLRTRQSANSAHRALRAPVWGTQVRDRLIASIARRQHGAFNRRQAIDAGFTARMIRNRLDVGSWVSLDRGVYALTSHPFSWERQVMAATLAVPGSVVSGRSAAALHGFDGYRRGGIELTASRRRNGRTSLARVRRSDFVQVTRVAGIPCLTAAHTVLSLAGRVSEDLLDRAVDHVLVRRLASLDELLDRFASWAPRRQPRVDQLRATLSTRGDGSIPPATELERRLRFLLTDATLPTFIFEHELPWWPAGQGRVDAYAPDVQLIVEADGRAWHSRERDFALDRRRDNLAVANGHSTLRFTWIDLTRYVAEARVTLRQTVSARRSSKA